jgi:hypothetical protein
MYVGERLVACGRGYTRLDQGTGLGQERSAPASSPRRGEGEHVEQQATKAEVCGGRERVPRPLPVGDSVSGYVAESGTSENLRRASKPVKYLRSGQLLD